MVRNVEVRGVSYDVTSEEEYREALLEAIKWLIEKVGNIKNG